MMTVTTGTGAPNAIGSPQELAAAREARGWSVSEAAQRMRLAPRQIEALEHGDWTELPGGAFVRGALRGYGRLLGLNVEPLIEALGEGGRLSDLRPSSSLSAPMPRGEGLDFSVGAGGRRGRLVLIAVTLVVIGAVALLYGRSTLRTGDDAVPASVTPPVGGAPSGAAAGIAPGAVAAGAQDSQGASAPPASVPGTVVETLRPDAALGGLPAAPGAVANPAPPPAATSPRSRTP